MSTWTINPSEEESYRELHGSSSLLLYSGRGNLFICKHHDAAGATLVEVGTHVELAVTADEFKSEFSFCFMDEAVFFFGSPEAQASAQRQLDAQIAASQFCIEQDRVARGLVH